jgi:hypothetical protein
MAMLNNQRVYIYIIVYINWKNIEFTWPLSYSSIEVREMCTQPPVIVFAYRVQLRMDCIGTCFTVLQFVIPSFR